jgi:hypothetical protein
MLEVRAARNEAQWCGIKKSLEDWETSRDDHHWDNVQ